MLSAYAKVCWELQHFYLFLKDNKRDSLKIKRIYNLFLNFQKLKLKNYILRSFSLIKYSEHNIYQFETLNLNVYKILLVLYSYYDTYMK